MSLALTTRTTPITPVLPHIPMEYPSATNGTQLSSPAPARCPRPAVSIPDMFSPPRALKSKSKSRPDLPASSSRTLSAAGPKRPPLHVRPALAENYRPLPHPNPHPSADAAAPGVAPFLPLAPIPLPDPARHGPSGSRPYSPPPSSASSYFSHTFSPTSAASSASSASTASPVFHFVGVSSHVVSGSGELRQKPTRHRLTKQQPPPPLPQQQQQQQQPCPASAAAPSDHKPRDEPASAIPSLFARPTRRASLIGQSQSVDQENPQPVPKKSSSKSKPGRDTSSALGFYPKQSSDARSASALQNIDNSNSIQNPKLRSKPKQVFQSLFGQRSNRLSSSDFPPLSKDAPSPAAGTKDRPDAALDYRLQQAAQEQQQHNQIAAAVAGSSSSSSSQSKGHKSSRAKQVSESESRPKRVSTPPPIAHLAHHIGTSGNSRPSSLLVSSSDAAILAIKSSTKNKKLPNPKDDAARSSDSSSKRKIDIPTIVPVRESPSPSTRASLSLVAPPKTDPSSLAPRQKHRKDRSVDESVVSGSRRSSAHSHLSQHDLDAQAQAPQPRQKAKSAKVAPQISDRVTDRASGLDPAGLAQHWTAGPRPGSREDGNVSESSSPGAVRSPLQQGLEHLQPSSQQGYPTDESQQGTVYSNSTNNNNNPVYSSVPPSPGFGQEAGQWMSTYQQPVHGSFDEAMGPNGGSKNFSLPLSTQELGSLPMAEYQEGQPIGEAVPVDGQYSQTRHYNGHSQVGMTEGGYQQYGQGMTGQAGQPSATSHEKCQPRCEDYLSMRDRYNKLAKRQSSLKSKYEDANQRIIGLENLIASFQVSQSRTSLDDQKYLDGLSQISKNISQLAHLIRKDWIAVPPFLREYVNHDALSAGSREMIAVGRSFVSAILCREVFDKFYHGGLKPEMSRILYRIQLALVRKYNQAQSADEAQMCLSQLVSWRNLTLDGLLAEKLRKPKAEVRAKENIENISKLLSASILAHLRGSGQGPDTDESVQSHLRKQIEAPVQTIVKQTFDLVNHIPFESRILIVDYAFPSAPFKQEVMQAHTSPIPNLKVSCAQAETEGVPLGTSSTESDRMSPGGGENEGGEGEGETVRFSLDWSLQVLGRPEVLRKMNVYVM